MYHHLTAGNDLMQVEHGTSLSCLEEHSMQVDAIYIN